MCRQQRISCLWIGVSGLVSFAVVNSATYAEPSWPFVRGVHADGHSAESGIVDSWPEGGPPVLWVRELGQGYSSFVGQRDRVFTQYQTTFGQYVVCLEAASGEEIWSHRYGFPYEAAGMYPGPRSTPTLAGNRVYFTGPDGTVGCLEQQDGDVVWTRNLFEDFGVELVDFGYSCSPTVVGDRIYLPIGPPDASLVALDANTGRTVWNEGDSPASHVPILPVRLGQRRLLVGLLKNHLVIHDEESGQRLVRLKLSHGYDEHAAWPIYSEPYLWISGPFQAGSRLLRLVDESGKPNGTDGDEWPTLKVESVWQSKVMSNDVASSVLVDGHLYGFDLKDVQSKPHRPSFGQFKCIDFMTGQERWAQGKLRERRRLNDDVVAWKSSVGHSSVFAIDDKLILFNDIGEVILVRVNPEQFELLARVRVLGDEIVWTQPMLLNGRLYLRNHSRAVCLFLGDPDQLANADVVAITVGDIPQSKYVDWVSILLPVEPEFAMDSPTNHWLWNWYFICLAIGWGVAPALSVVGLSSGRMWGQNWLTRRRVRTSRRLIAFVIAAVGTTLVSKLQNDFVFTWPLCLAVAFDQLLGMAAHRNGDTRKRSFVARLGDWLALGAFVLLCLIYFWICRRLSLAAEWPFLIGFPGGYPFLLVSRMCARRDGWQWMVLEWICDAVAFTAFYGVAVCVIGAKFGITWLG